MAKINLNRFNYEEINQIITECKKSGKKVEVDERYEGVYQFGSPEHSKKRVIEYD